MFGEHALYMREGRENRKAVNPLRKPNLGVCAFYKARLDKIGPGGEPNATRTPSRFHRAEPPG